MRTPLSGKPLNQSSGKCAGLCDGFRAPDAAVAQDVHLTKVDGKDLAAAPNCEISHLLLPVEGGVCAAVEIRHCFGQGQVLLRGQIGLFKHIL